MRRPLLAIAFVACTVVGLPLALEVVTVDAPIHFGMLFVDYPDPLRPGHLKGVQVSLPELIFKAALALTMILIGIKIGFVLAKSRTPTQTSG